VRRFVRVLGLATIALVVLAAPVSAARPQMERITVDDLFVDEFLSETCGIEVMGHFTGHIIFRAFTDATGSVVREVNNFALSGRFWSELGSVGFKDVGVDRVTYTPDGFINVIVGNVQSISVPGEGRVYANVGQTTLQFTVDDQGEITDVQVLREVGQHEGDQVAVICSVLNP
jgi:hypothetical protein